MPVHTTDSKVDELDRTCTYLIKIINKLEKEIANLKDYLKTLVPECENCHWDKNRNEGWDVNMCDDCKPLRINWKHKEF